MASHRRRGGGGGRAVGGAVGGPVWGPAGRGGRRHCGGGGGGGWDGGGRGAGGPWPRAAPASPAAPQPVPLPPPPSSGACGRKWGASGEPRVPTEEGTRQRHICGRARLAAVPPVCPRTPPHIFDVAAAELAGGRGRRAGAAAAGFLWGKKPQGHLGFLPARARGGGRGWLPCLPVQGGGGGWGVRPRRQGVALKTLCRPRDLPQLGAPTVVGRWRPRGARLCMDSPPPPPPFPLLSCVGAHGLVSAPPSSPPPTAYLLLTAGALALRRYHWKRWRVKPKSRPAARAAPLQPRGRCGPRVLRLRWRRQRRRRLWRLRRQRWPSAAGDHA